ncbi:hypothetical protein ACWGF3_08615 [Streptomyces xanthophaeus]|uniref:Uncharacterized protein n=1 Tax=Streptomyces xanthophaeus TaxID=67385 RepID=A0A919GSI0_9ACTN|nr:hypothetical protein [Streptomyces xanthophaeus]GHI83160.1 hypothetical protein Sxan_05240 [Streptomyces xanthophaeus]
MSLPVHALTHRPLRAAAVSELRALPTAPHVPEEFDALDTEVRRRGWNWEHELIANSFRTAHGHVVCTDGPSPFGRPDARTFLVFGELYPVDPDDGGMDNASWLYGLIDDWQAQPGWSGRRPCTDQHCEAVLARAALAVTAHLGAPPERTVRSCAAVVTGPALTHRIWRTPTHALVLGPAADNGPYGLLTHLQLSCTPLTCGPDLPPAGDEDALARWITAHVDW